jgi:hypothetical protein
MADNISTGILSGLYEKVYNPDVLSCLANLSSDEVFTPPEIVNKMLDMLPQERVFFIFKRTATVFGLYDRKLSCENFGKEIACSAGGFEKTAVDTLGFLFYKVAHCLYFTLGGENLAVFGNTLSGFYLLLHLITFCI